jgi:hypothetical protein
MSDVLIPEGYDTRHPKVGARNWGHYKDGFLKVLAVWEPQPDPYAERPRRRDRHLWFFCRCELCNSLITIRSDHFYRVTACGCGRTAEGRAKLAERVKAFWDARAAEQQAYAELSVLADAEVAR